MKLTRINTRYRKRFPFFLALFMFLPLGAELHFKNADEMLEFVKRIVPNDPVILEAGGRFGEDTARMKTVWPGAIMHVFEPLPSSYKQVLENTKDLSSVITYPFALTTFTGKTYFYVNPNNVGASSIGYPVEWNENEFEKTPIEVPCTTLDEWAERNNVTHIDFMWLDMEGHELYALECGKNLLNNVQAIFTEISFVPVRQGSRHFDELKSFLEAQGFCEVWKSCDYGRYGDALFIRKNP